MYNLDKDWTQANDLAATMPDKLRDLKELWTLEAAKYNVFPLDDSVLPRFIGPKPNYTPFRTELVDVPFPGTGGAPNMLNKSYTITAEIEVPQGGGEGMLVTDGGRFAGYGFYLLKGVPVFTWNLIQLERVKWRGKEALSPGKHTLEFDWKYDGPGLGKGGAGTLKVDARSWTAIHAAQFAGQHRLVRGILCRRRHRDAGGRQGLPGAVPLHRQARQAGDSTWAGRAYARGKGDDLQDLPRPAIGGRTRHGGVRPVKFDARKPAVRLERLADISISPMASRTARTEASLKGR